MFSLKKAAAGVLSCTMLLGSLVISGCSDSNTSGTQSADNTSSGSSTAHQGEIKDISSVELVKDMKIGWSLGNTLDAGNESNRGQDPGSIEKSWGNPDTTKEMIDEIKKAGFNVLRVPTTWDWSTGEAPEYKISDEWFARVKEIVDYGMETICTLSSTYITKHGTILPRTITRRQATGLKRYGRKSAITSRIMTSILYLRDLTNPE